MDYISKLSDFIFYWILISLQLKRRYFEDSKFFYSLKIGYAMTLSPNENNNKNILINTIFLDLLKVS